MSNQYIPVYNIDFSTLSTTSNYPVTNASQCADRCNSSIACNGYIIDGEPSNPATTTQCWLKFGVVDSVPVVNTNNAQKRSTFFKRPTNGNYLFLQNVDFLGNEYSANIAYPATDIQKCLSYCSSDINCKGFVIKNQQCIFKNNLEGNGIFSQNINIFIKGF